MSAARACGRIEVGQSASAGESLFDGVVWLGFVVGFEVGRRGRVRRVMIVKKRIILLEGREGIVNWGWEW